MTGPVVVPAHQERAAAPPLAHGYPDVRGDGTVRAGDVAYCGYVRGTHDSDPAVVPRWRTLSTPFACLACAGLHCGSWS